MYIFIKRCSWHPLWLYQHLIFKQEQRKIRKAVILVFNRAFQNISCFSDEEVRGAGPRCGASPCKNLLRAFLGSVLTLITPKIWPRSFKLMTWLRANFQWEHYKVPLWMWFFRSSLLRAGKWLRALWETSVNSNFRRGRKGAAWEM